MQAVCSPKKGTAFIASSRKRLNAKRLGGRREKGGKGEMREMVKSWKGEQVIGEKVKRRKRCKGWKG